MTGCAGAQPSRPANPADSANPDDSAHLSRAHGPDKENLAVSLNTLSLDGTVRLPPEPCSEPSQPSTNASHAHAASSQQALSVADSAGAVSAAADLAPNADGPHQHASACGLGPDERTESEAAPSTSQDQPAASGGPSAPDSPAAGSQSLAPGTASPARRILRPGDIPARNSGTSMRERGHSLRSVSGSGYGQTQQAAGASQPTAVAAPASKTSGNLRQAAGRRQPTVTASSSSASRDHAGGLGGSSPSGAGRARQATGLPQPSSSLGNSHRSSPATPSTPQAARHSGEAPSATPGSVPRTPQRTNSRIAGAAPGLSRTSTSKSNAQPSAGPSLARPIQQQKALSGSTVSGRNATRGANPRGLLRSGAQNSQTGAVSPAAMSEAGAAPTAALNEAGNASGVAPVTAPSSTASRTAADGVALRNSKTRSRGSTASKPSAGQSGNAGQS